MLILFDIDGTLVHTQGAGRESTRDAMLEVYGTESRLATHHFGGKTDWQTLIELLEDHGFDSAEIGRRMPVYQQVIARHLERIIPTRQVMALPGTLDAVRTLYHREGIVLGIVTGNVETTAPIKLRAAGFEPAWFRIGAYGSDAVFRDELTPIALQRAIAYAGREFTQQEIVVIGDTVADIQCARVIGARAIAVTTGFEAREALVAAQPDHLLDDLTTLLDLL